MSKVSTESRAAQLIKSRELKLQEQTISAISKIKLEWDIQGLRQDIERWKQTLDKINEMLGD